MRNKRTNKIPDVRTQIIPVIIKNTSRAEVQPLLIKEANPAAVAPNKTAMSLISLYVI
jgi:hypothetical protein